MKETELMRQIRDAVSRSGLVTLWRNNCGVDIKNGVRYGLGLGSADLVGFRHSDGKFVAIEIKTDAGRVSPQQRAWLEFVRGHGCLAGVARTIDEALRIIKGES